MNKSIIRIKRMYAETTASTTTKTVKGDIPTLWLATTLGLVFNKTVALNQVVLDYNKSEISEKGERILINTPAQLKSKRLAGGADTVSDEVKYDTEEIILNQYIYSSFHVSDRYEAMSLDDASKTFLTPAAESIAQRIDKLLLHKSYEFPTMGSIEDALDEATFRKLRTFATRNNWPDTGRFFDGTPEANESLYAIERFTEKDKVINGGSAIRDGYLGKLYTFQVIDSNNIPYVNKEDVPYVDGVAIKSDVVAGLDTYLVTETSASVVVGSTIVFGENVYTAKTVTNNATDTTVVLNSVLVAPITTATTYLTLAPATLSSAIVFNEPTLGYYDGSVAVDSMSDVPLDGQKVMIGDYVGSVDGVNTEATKLWTMDVVTEVSDTAKPVSFGAHGSYNLAFTKNAMAFVSRPLPKPKAKYVDSRVLSFKNIGMRITFDYDSQKNGGTNTVKLDMLCGAKIIRPTNGVCVLSK